MTTTFADIVAAAVGLLNEEAVLLILLSGAVVGAFRHIVRGVKQFSR